MTTTDTRYTARFALPDLIEIGRDNTLQCPVYLDGALVAPTEAGSTVTIYDDSGTAVVSAGPVTVSSSIATYAYGSGLSSDDLAEGWRIEWSLVMPDGVIHVFRQDAAVVRRRLYPTISDIDLFRRESSLDPSGNDPITTLSDFQNYIDEADVELQSRLIEAGNRPNLITSPSALRSTWLMLTLAIIFEDLATRLNPAFAEKASRYADKYERAYTKAAFLYDADDDGEADDAHRRRGAQPTYWLSGRAST